MFHLYDNVQDQAIKLIGNIEWCKVSFTWPLLDPSCWFILKVCIARALSNPINTAVTFLIVRINQLVKMTQIGSTCNWGSFSPLSQLQTSYKHCLLMNCSWLIVMFGLGTVYLKSLWLFGVICHETCAMRGSVRITGTTVPPGFTREEGTGKTVFQAC